MSMKREAFLEETIFTLTQCLATTTDPYQSSALEGFLKQFNDFIGELDEEEITDKLKGEDEHTLLYQRVINTAKGKVFRDATDYNLFKDQSERIEAGVKEWLLLLFSSSQEDMQPLKRMRERVNEFIRENKENVDENGVLRLVLGDILEYPSVNAVVTLVINGRKEPWERAYLEITHTTDWFIKPLTHRKTGTIKYADITVMLNAQLKTMMGDLFDTRVLTNRVDNTMKVAKYKLVEWDDNRSYTRKILPNGHVPEGDDNRNRTFDACDHIYRQLFWMSQ